MTIYLNPRLHTLIDNWPLGGNKRGPADFTIEQHPKRGERAVRTTTGKPKTLTYSVKQRIVDGDDGRTYIACLTVFGTVSVFNGDMKLQHEYIGSNDPRLAEVMALFN